MSPKDGNAQPMALQDLKPKVKNFIYNEDKGVVFAFVPKVACTNWKSIMRHLNGEEDYLASKLTHNVELSGLTFLDIDGEDRRIFEDPEVRTIAFVRNPYSRALSAYLDKVGKYLPTDDNRDAEGVFFEIARAIEDFRKSHPEASVHPSINFEVFLLWLRDSGHPHVNNGHWLPQSSLLREGQLTFDVLGRFESLADDAGPVLKMMGSTVPFPTQKDNKFPPTEARKRLDLHYSEKAYQLVEELYRADFAAYRYPMRGQDVPITDKRPGAPAGLEIGPDESVGLTAMPGAWRMDSISDLERVFGSRVRQTTLDADGPLCIYFNDFVAYASDPRQAGRSARRVAEEWASAMEDLIEALDDRGQGRVVLVRSREARRYPQEMIARVSGWLGADVPRGSSALPPAVPVGPDPVLTLAASHLVRNYPRLSAVYAKLAPYVVGLVPPDAASELDVWSVLDSQLSAPSDREDLARLRARAEAAEAERDELRQIAKDLRGLEQAMVGANAAWRKLGGQRANAEAAAVESSPVHTLLQRYRALSPFAIRDLAEQQEPDLMDWRAELRAKPTSITRWRAIKRYKKRTRKAGRE